MGWQISTLNNSMAGGLGLCDCRRLGGRRVDGAGAGRDCGCGGTAQAMGSCLLGALCRRCGRSLGIRAAPGLADLDRDPGFSRDRIDRSRVYGGLHQRRVAGAGRQGRNRPHLRVGLGVGLLGRACEPGAGPRPDRACAGLGTDRHRFRADPGPRPRARRGRQGCRAVVGALVHRLRRSLLSVDPGRAAPAASRTRAPQGCGI